MKTVATICQWIVRLSGILLILLGIGFWFGRGLRLVSVHMLLGVLLVLALWVLAVSAMTLGARIGLVAGSIVWGLVVLVVGSTQQSILPGSAHWVIQVLHLLIGLAAIGLSERLGAVAKRSAAVSPARS